LGLQVNMHPFTTVASAQKALEREEVRCLMSGMKDYASQLEVSRSESDRLTKQMHEKTDQLNSRIRELEDERRARDKSRLEQLGEYRIELDKTCFQLEQSHSDRDSARNELEQAQADRDAARDQLRALKESLRALAV
jgi:vacuolar-type H+-ATPase subunit I/STV1